MGLRGSRFAPGRDQGSVERREGADGHRRRGHGDQEEAGVRGPANHFQSKPIQHETFFSRFCNYKLATNICTNKKFLIFKIKLTFGEYSQKSILGGFCIFF
jgi:hypothetical protein